MNRSERGSSYTIAQFMVAVVVLAVVFTVLSGPQNFRGISILVGFLGLGLVMLASLVAFVDMYLSSRCPLCQHWSMVRQSIASFRDRYYRCNHCQARCRRGMFSGWTDASGAEFDTIYARKRPENPWTAAPHVDEEDQVFSKTHVNLLLNKQRRNPNPPDQNAGRTP